ncbi:glycosyltransferase family 25 protein [Paracoccus caeni]|uniref:Glycosyltransferase family 25 protein n=1 Tax=Paracoccus caeni TaxID=657651 RepID=A0A934SF87_9RHOB|nr:glycosyltransferase family 25 protein [Paracoccus caeni]MBK4217806.1 glycosyltransferase family 25 protein [Paracoccus caeni]
MSQPLMPESPKTDSLKIYLINLDRAEERLAHMQTKLAEAGLDHERVAAVDGATLTLPHPDFDARAYRYLHGRRAIPAELGCYFSHVECARRLLESKASHALILEDDVTFPEDFRRLLANALENAEDWDILRLSSVNRGPKFPYKRLPDGRSLAIAFTREKGAGAYLINRAAAEWIVAKLMPMRLSYDIAFDLEYLDGLRASFIDPVPVGQRDEPVSQIQVNIRAAKYPPTRYLTVLPYRLWLETSRLAMRFWCYTRFSFRYEPRRALLRAVPTVLAVILGVDEVFFDH